MVYLVYSLALNRSSEPDSFVTKSCQPGDVTTLGVMLSVSNAAGES